jgi:asparagine synthase (glutamine-hydrolyzing)
MCGIAGIVAESYDKRLIPSMLEVMKHRGPDSQGFFLSGEVHIGHCRLSIIDLSDLAKQPFISLENNVAVAVNGEIYNFNDLKKPLQKNGYRFQSNSDSEVVLHAYIEHGLDFITDLNGMFAISIWDGRKKELFLIRDRLGIKPLYYTKAKSAFLFASEIKALAFYSETDLSLDIQSFVEYLAFENYFSNRTLNENIKIVEPGEIIRFSFQDKLIKKKYFWQPDLDVSKHYHGGNVYKKYIDIVESSVNRHLISDVPIGCYLSAGIDSPSVAYWASKRYGHNLKTFTGSFGMSGFYDEATDAAKIAKNCDYSNNRIEIRPKDFIENIEKLLWHLDEPRVGMGAFSQYMVAREAAKEVKVILTGHGGDEFFAGYPVFKAVYGGHNVSRLLLHSSFREMIFAVYFSFLPKFKKELSYFLPNIYSLKSLKNLLRSDFYDNLIKSANIFKEPESLKNTCNDKYKQLTLTYLRYYLPSLFIVEDKISMAFSMESRTPLCDNEMLDFALSLPLSMKLGQFELKHIPRIAMRGKLPDFIYKLPKRGFPTPLRYWFKKELKGYIKDFIFDNIASVDMFDKEEVKKLIWRYQNSKTPNPFDEITAHKIWVILNLIIYFKSQRQRYKTKTLL